MVAIWMIAGAVCGILSLFLRMLGQDYGNLITGILSWGLFACVMVLVTRRKQDLFQFIGGSAMVGTLLMVLGMLPLGVIAFIPGGEEISKRIEFAYLSRAIGGAISGLALFYLWRFSEKVRSSSPPAEGGASR